MAIKMLWGGLGLPVAALCTVAHAETPADMPPRTWLEIPDTAMMDVAPAPDEFSGTWGVVGPAAVIGAWNSAALDTTRNRLILHGGGHNDYYGNELYAFDVDTLRWERLTDPTEDPTPGSDVNWDGTPGSRHTYNGTTYIGHLDRFFVFGGSGSTIGDGGFPPTDNVWSYDFAAEAWSFVHTPYPPGPGHGEGSSAIYDPMTEVVWWGDGRNSNPSDGWGLWSWNPDDEAWTRHTEESVFSSATGCLDTSRGMLVFVGGGAVRAFDVRGDGPELLEWATSGETAIIDEVAPGVAYDPQLDRVLAWQGGAVSVLDPETLVWEVIDAPGAPSPDASRGTYGRFLYVPSVNAFASINDANDNVYFFKHGEGGGAPPGGGSSSGGDDETGDATSGAGTSSTSAGSGSGPDAGTATTSPPATGGMAMDSGDASDAAGCGCRSGDGGLASGMLLLLVGALRRRRR